MNFAKLSSSFVFAAALAGVSGSVAAADYRNNPFTLVYDGAIRQNEVGKVNIRPVSYTVNGIKIAANVARSNSARTTVKKPMPCWKACR